MKKFLSLLLLSTAGLAVLCLSLSCSTNNPSAPNNFQTPVSIVSGINPTNSFTPTYTFTPSFTPTSTSTITFTPTPFVTVAPWTGLSAPSGIAVDGSGSVYVADTGHNQIKKFNSNGILITSWGNGGKGKGSVSFSSPQCLAVNSAGTTLYALGSGTAGVFQYDVSGNYVAQLNVFTFSNPQGIALDGSGNIYVSDPANNRVVQLASAGQHGSGFGGGGIFSLTVPTTVGSLTLNSPATLSGLAVNGTSVYVATQGANVQSGSVTYSALLAIDIPTGNIINIIPGFDNPSGVAFDSNNDLYVADTGKKQAEEFTDWPAFNQPPLQFNNGGSLNSPKGIAVDSYFNIYVTDSATNEVVKFTP